ncbi:polysaccharide biosynthesis C-terminal domain-containing protein [Sinomicrobium weinanense]|uniref:Polysaccharide biosynthesis protein n=1 Tax=Sinomicrobium weinanense TaxID=2842200 RepID=A0A926Q353_9FLAO|nr:oligosaccharide flippase family protein [Sinomicrobium weinanense]MBC9795641.1 polysaccharide biosynthesis protein [Sinomicrobium weinanense]MBU3122810.1 oligosaccharide flippase family protein [Sinomicrobium weinanense]
MGIVARQTLKNTVSTYSGFALGAVNTLFLYTNFLTEEYYGLVGYLLSTANILMPLFAFGVHNTMVKYFSFYKEGEEQRKFVFMMFVLPLFVIVPAGLLGIVGYNYIAAFLSQKNPVVRDYVWAIYGVAFAMAYFEVFFAWVKVHMRSTFGNFMKEVFSRAVVMILLFAVYFNWIGVERFVIYLMGMYILRTLLMMIYAWKVQKPHFIRAFPVNATQVWKYSGLIVLAGSIAVVLLDIDKFMIGQYVVIDNVAFYNVAVYIAMVIVVPSRAMHQITYPMTAKLMNNNLREELGLLYKRSSLTLYVIGGLLFLWITLNVGELYRVIPGNYSDGITVVFFIAVAKLSENLMGNNNSILFNSDYYRIILFFGVFLAGLTVVLNMIFIPVWGIHGAAFATLLAILVYNSTKIGFVYFKLKMHPFTDKTWKTTLAILFVLLVFGFWDFDFYPLVNIGLKSVLIGAVYLFLVYQFHLSEDIVEAIRKVLKKKARR